MKQSLGKGIRVWGMLFIVNGLLPLSLLSLGVLPKWLWIVFVPLPVWILATGVNAAISWVWIIVGISVMKRKPWARFLTLCSAAVFATLSLLQMVLVLLSGIPMPLSYVLSLAGYLAVFLGWYGLLFWYFLRPSVKAQFKRAHST